MTGESLPVLPAARELVSRLRPGPLHDELGQVPYQVGGETATSIDATQAMFDSLPRVGLALLVIVALVLLFALRSVFLPVEGRRAGRAVAGRELGITAAAGHHQARRDAHRRERAARHPSHRARSRSSRSRWR